MLQDFTLEHDDAEVIALAVQQALEWGAPLGGSFICPAPFVPPWIDLPSHTLAHYRGHHHQPILDPDSTIPGHIAAVGACWCQGAAKHPEYGARGELGAAVLRVLREADRESFVE